jgi:hypothetical protein
VVQVNHINGMFDPLRIDTSQTPPQSVLDGNSFDINGYAMPDNPLFFRLDPNDTDLYHHFPALELWNGYTISQQNEFLVERIGIWMNLLNQGLPTTNISDTDTHELHNLRSAGARSWTPASSDAVGRRGRRISCRCAPARWSTRHLRADAAARHRRLAASRRGLVPSGTPATTAAARSRSATRRGSEIRVQARRGRLRPHRDLPQRLDAGREAQSGQPGGT